MPNKRLNQIRRVCHKEHAHYYELDDMITKMFDVIIHHYKIYKHCFISTSYYSYSCHGVEDWKDVGATFYPRGLYNNGPTIIIFMRTIRNYVLDIIKQEFHQQNVLDWHQAVYKELLKILRHEFRHYQQYKYFKDNGLDFLDYIDLLKMNDTPYDQKMTEVDAALYSEDPENSGSLNFLIMDYCVGKIHFLEKLIKKNPEHEEEYQEQIQKLYEVGRKFIDHEEIDNFCQSNNNQLS